MSPRAAAGGPELERSGEGGGGGGFDHQRPLRQRPCAAARSRGGAASPRPSTAGGVQTELERAPRPPRAGECPELKAGRAGLSRARGSRPAGRALPGIVLAAGRVGGAAPPAGSRAGCRGRGGAALPGALPQAPHGEAGRESWDRRQTRPVPPAGPGPLPRSRVPAGGAAPTPVRSEVRAECQTGPGLSLHSMVPGLFSKRIDSVVL